ncbi:MAG: HNH endonuclease [Anaerovoracaceae bacterium]
MRQRDKFLCAVCREKGIYQFKDLSVHHIVPLEEDADRCLDDDNLITLCLEHHKEAEAGKIERSYLNRLVVRK